MRLRFWFLLLALSPLLSWSLGQNLQALEAQAQEAQRQEERLRARIELLNRELAQLSGRIEALLKERARLEAEVARLEGERSRLRQEIARLREEIQATETRIRKLQEELKALEDRLKALIQSLYREGARRYLLLLRSESFLDLLVRARWVGYISARDAETVRAFRATLKALEEERVRLGLLLQDLEAKEKALAEAQAQVLERKQALEANLASLQREQAGRRALLRESLRARSELQERIRALQAQILAERRRLEALRRQEEERRRREEAQRRQAAQVVLPPPPLPAAVGRLAFPIPGGRVAVPYGAEGPFQVLAGPSPGSPVQAAADGYVGGVLYIPNLGWTVMLVHTESLATVYTNLQEPLVQEGQRVARGQLLGYTGGGLLMRPEELEFRVALDQGGRTVFVDPSAYY